MTPLFVALGGTPKSEPVTNQQVADYGIFLEDYPCDWNPVEKTSESNASVEAVYSYKGNEYLVFQSFEGEVYFPNRKAQVRQ